MTSPLTHCPIQLITIYIIFTFSIVNNPNPCHPYMFITENFYSNFTSMSFWASALKSPSENGFLQKISGDITANPN